MSNAGAVVEIQELMARYCYAHDAHDVAGVARCFAPDAVHLGKHGPEEIGAYYVDMYATQTARRRHVLTNFFVIADDGLKAEAKATIQLFLIRNGVAELHTVGIYNISAIRATDGWRLLGFHADLDLPYSPGDNPLHEAERRARENRDAR